MTSATQLLIFGACSLIIGSVCVAGLEKSKSTSSVSYPAKASKNQARQVTGELSTAASTIPFQAQNGYQYPLTQPSVYHSIIDRTAAASQPASPVQATTAAVGDLQTAAGHHHGHGHGKYYEYREVPKKKTWKFGYKRGNHKHTISRHEHGKAGKHPHFKTKVKWHDKKSKGKGIHLWDYNHHDKKHYHHG